jgi:hypothetical protein
LEVNFLKDYEHIVGKVIEARLSLDNARRKFENPGETKFSVRPRTETYEKIADAHGAMLDIGFTGYHVLLAIDSPVDSELEILDSENGGVELRISSPKKED